LKSKYEVQCPSVPTKRKRHLGRRLGEKKKFQKDKTRGPVTCQASLKEDVTIPNPVKNHSGKVQMPGGRGKETRNCP